MPTYDFTCQNCNQRFDVFMIYSEYGTRPVPCSHCGSENTRRRMTRVRVMKSEESRFDDLEGDMGGLEGLEDDPKALGHMMRKMGKQMGEELPLDSMMWLTAWRPAKVPKRSSRPCPTWETRPRPTMTFKTKSPAKTTGDFDSGLVY
jgi:putative FmdB family regulatory protein